MNRSIGLSKLNLEDLREGNKKPGALNSYLNKMKQEETRYNTSLQSPKILTELRSSSNYPNMFDMSYSIDFSSSGKRC